MADGVSYAQGLTSVVLGPQLRTSRAWRARDSVPDNAAAEPGRASGGSTRVMIEKFANVCSTVRSESLDLNHTSKFMLLVCPLIPKFARDAGFEVWRTSESGH
jgi:hypothetical protein